MGVACPHCRHALALKNLRPGRFTPRCPHCGQAFLLSVAGEGNEPVASPLPAAPPVIPTGPTVAPGTAGADSADFSVPAEPRGPNEAEAPAAEDGPEVPVVLGNYQVLKPLGRGGMGAVYLARQVSLDRPVALKVLNPRWAVNPAFVARFTREAYAAAQLVHHNVVQIYDIGAEGGLHYFSMEYVDGESLAGLLKRGRLAPEVAAGYVLQAARGLKFAHDRGMIHRDVKPDNLLLNSQGIVKVADLGLVKTPGLVEAPLAAVPVPVPGRVTLAGLSGITLANQAMGTPAYMAPEQARDPATVDHRADIYALGCTLYVLLTGRPVFAGANPLEVMTRHATDPVVRPETLVPAVPRALSDIVLKMLAKKPADRYARMDDVITALESFLGIHGAGQNSPREEHLRTLESSARAFREAPAARLRARVLAALYGGCTLLVFVGLLFGWRRVAGGALGLGLLSGLAYFVVHGLAQRGHLFLKARQVVLGSTWSDRLLALAGLLLLGAVLHLLGLLSIWVGVSVLALAVALAVHYALDRPLAQQRAAPLEKAERMLRALRLCGLSEEALQEFVCRYAGERWEEFFEALFGYEAKLAARTRWGLGPRGLRPRFGAWRDPVVRWIDSFVRARAEARARGHLQAVEQKRLEAEGLAATEARARAERVAEAVVARAAEVGQAPPAAPAAVPVALPVAQPAPGTQAVPEAMVASAVTLPLRPVPAVPAEQAPPVKRITMQDLVQAAEEPAAPRRRNRLLPRLAGALLGSKVRFLAGAVLLAGCLVWVNARDLVPQAEGLLAWSGWREWWYRAEVAQPLRVPLLPALVGQVLSTCNAGLAGLLLVLSAVWRSPKMGLFLLPAAALMAVGPLYPAPAGVPLTPNLFWLACGGALALLGFLFGRDT
jgi:hypothetical protein